MAAGMVLNGVKKTVSSGLASATEAMFSSGASRPASVTCGGVKPRARPARILSACSSK
jgi:hypothetical protein